MTHVIYGKGARILIVDDPYAKPPPLRAIAQRMNIGVLAAAAGYDAMREGKTWWPELAPLKAHERDTIKRWLADRLTYDAAAPQSPAERRLAAASLRRRGP